MVVSSETNTREGFATIPSCCFVAPVVSPSSLSAFVWFLAGGCCCCVLSSSFWKQQHSWRIPNSICSERNPSARNFWFQRLFGREACRSNPSTGNYSFLPLGISVVVAWKGNSGSFETNHLGEEYIRVFLFSDDRCRKSPWLGLIGCSVLSIFG